MHTGRKEAGTQNVGSTSCVLPFQRDATVGDSQIFVIILVMDGISDRGELLEI